MDVHVSAGTRSTLSFMNHDTESAGWVWNEQKRQLPTPFSGLCCCWGAGEHFLQVWNTGWPCLYAFDIYIRFFSKTLLKGANFCWMAWVFLLSRVILVKALMSMVLLLLSVPACIRCLCAAEWIAGLAAFRSSFACFCYVKGPPQDSGPQCRKQQCILPSAPK